MSSLGLRMTLASVLLLGWAVAVAVPPGIDAARQVAAADDPARLSDLGLERAFDGKRAAAEIDAALGAGDIELAQSVLDLADERGVAVAAERRARIAAASTGTAAAIRVAGRFAHGFAVGTPDDLAGLAGTLAGDLMVYGDVRDVVRETARMARGEAADELILGLACVGLAITAGTYATFGAGAPARIGISLVKAAGKTGRLSRRLVGALAPTLKAAIDPVALRAALRPMNLLQPAVAVRGVRAAVKADKAQDLVKVAADVGRINGKAGTRATLDALKLADSPKDVARLARLADAKGGRTRAVLKVLGRGAIALSVGLFELASWMFWALLSLVGFVAGLKRSVERMAERSIARGKLRRARRRTQVLASAAAGG